MRVLMHSLTLGAVLCACGCGDGRTPVYPVQGRVLFKGLPTSDVMIVFHAAAPPAATVPIKPYATVNTDGTFALTTYATGDGAPAGEYIVTLVPALRERQPSAPPPGPPPPERYGDPKKSPFRATVAAREVNELAVFEVTP